jgi:purine-cytosine permease-like protein
MLWFTEIDTVIFDAALLLAVFSIGSRLRLSLREPLTWLMLLITSLIGIPLVCVVSNFGTLFRLREMIYIGLAWTHDRGNKQAF